MLTADTITDDQIRELYAAGAISFDLLEFATFPAWVATQASYREHCAKIFNAREAHEIPLITTDNITDAQIAAVRDDERLSLTARTCAAAALDASLSRSHPIKVRGRARCAEILNARETITP